MNNQRKTVLRNNSKTLVLILLIVSILIGCFMLFLLMERADDNKNTSPAISEDQTQEKMNAAETEAKEKTQEPADKKSAYDNGHRIAPWYSDSKIDAEVNIDQHMGLWWFELLPVNDGRAEGLEITKKGKNEAEVLFYDILTKITFVNDNVAVTDRYGNSNEYQDVYTFKTDSSGKAMLEVNTVYAETGKISKEFIMAYRDREDFNSKSDYAQTTNLISEEEARQIAINTSGYKYAAYLNDNEEKFYFFLSDSKENCDAIEEAVERNGYIPNGIEKVIYSVLKTSGKCVVEFSNVSSDKDSNLSKSES